MEAFNKLHELLEPKLIEEFNIGPRSRGLSPNGEIPTKLRLSAAIRFFAGASIYDIMLTHGMGKQSVYDSIYGVVDVVNAEPSLSFNAKNGSFLLYDEQREIAKGFEMKSAAGFDKIMMAIDGMLIWMPVIGVWSATTKFALADHTRSGQFLLPAIARSADLRGRRSVLGGARMYVSQIH